MIRKGMKWLGICALSLPFTAQAQVDLTSLDRDMAGPRSQVLVLGSVHLNELPKGVREETLEPVIERLAAFKPQIITIERLPGEECERFFAVYGPRFCPGTDDAKQATGLGVSAASAEIDKMLKDWPASPTPAQRRRMAALFLAAGDSSSAYVQWLQLPAAERRAGDGLDDALVSRLGKIASSNDEGYQIGARLAARLGLQRVYPVDNHTGDNVQIDDGAAFGKALQDAWGSSPAGMSTREAQQQALTERGDMIALYRYINTPQSMRVNAEHNIVGPMRATSPQHYPQMWVGGWETRNLRMVANIRETFRERPGARVLSIVGVAHKPWFDGWLGQLQGVDIVDAQQVLK
ncbi:DUF5694 domain-containing protein [Lysobacter sp. FW306-1B-D06B]|uniref:DUF5694 domain-containing protein n=1 Tax=Lysobacter sp. FW306-1B-D06B TaxID=3140250 RepID=UPI00313FF670